MCSKSKKEVRKKESEKLLYVAKKRKAMDVRRGVTSRAVSLKTKCTMQLEVYLSNRNEWFLHKIAVFNIVIILLLTNLLNKNLRKICLNLTRNGYTLVFAVISFIALFLSYK
jgi:hypothetical protein